MKRFATAVGILGSVLLLAGDAGAVVIEGFEDGNITEYTATGSVNTSVTAAAAHDGSFGLAFAGVGGGEGWIWRNDAAVALAQGDQISWWTRTNASANSRNYLGFGASAGGCLSAVLGVNTGEFILQNNAGFGFLNLAAAPQVFQPQTWYRVEVDWGLGGAITARLFASDGTTLLNTINANDNSITSGGLAFRCFDNGDPGYFDTVEKVMPVPVDDLSWGRMKAAYK